MSHFVNCDSDMGVDRFSAGERRSLIDRGCERAVELGYREAPLLALTVMRSQQARASSLGCAV
jgi:hypothetical protein